MHYFWGGLMISLSALASALTGLAENGYDRIWLMHGIWKFFRILLAIFVPVSAALVTFLSYESRSSNHHRAAARFAALKRQLSIAILRAEAGEGIQSAQKTLEDVCKKWNELTENMPALYQKKWERQIARYEAELGRRFSSPQSSSSHARPGHTKHSPTEARIELSSEIDNGAQTEFLRKKILPADR